MKTRKPRPRAPLPRQVGGPHRTRKNEPARQAKHKGQLRRQEAES
jgi:hypothetical protein